LAAPASEMRQALLFLFSGKFSSGVEIAPKNLAVQKCGDKPNGKISEKNFCRTHKNDLSHS
jgi:hypothetical protein